MAHIGSGESRRAGAHGMANGQIVVGEYILQPGAPYGATVNPAPFGRGGELRGRLGRASLLPPRFPGLLDREAEVNRLENSLTSPQGPIPVEIYGPPGIGKTALLRFLARRPFAASFTDGVVYLYANVPLEDLLYELLAAFYVLEPGWRLDPLLARNSLASKRALILLDDASLPREEILELLGILPNSALILAGEERRLGSEGNSIQVVGLPLEAAVVLVSRELGRPLSEQENTAVKSLHAGLEGHPMRLLQAAALARETRRPLNEIAWKLPPGPVWETLGVELLASLSAIERQIVAAVACLEGAPVEEEQIAELLSLNDSATILESLVRRNILQAHSPQVTLAGGLEEVVGANWDLGSWKERMLVYLAIWAERQNSIPGRILESAQSIRQILSWGASTGRWVEVLRLARAVEPAFCLGSRWVAWEEILNSGLQAAQEIGDASAKAWAMHQLGTLALCRGDQETARGLLVRALRQREVLGDGPGLAVTRHNLSSLIGPTRMAIQPAAQPAMLQRTSPPPETAPIILVEPTPETKVFNPFPWVIAGLLGSALIVPLIILAALFFGKIGGTPAANLPTQTIPVILPGTSVTPATASPSPTPTTSRTPCGPPGGWLVYQVRFGDTLASIAAATGVTEAQILAANCLNNPTLQLGQQLFVPRLPVTLTPSPSSTITLTFTPTVVTPKPPDLAVTGITAGPYISLNARGEFLLPVRLGVANIGDSPAGDFKVSVSYRLAGSGQSPEVLVPFQVAGQEDPYFPHSKVSLPPGGQITFEGHVVIESSRQGQTILLWGVADSCAGELFPPPNCRVAESNEGNNVSAQVVLLLPDLTPPTLTPTPTATVTPSDTPTPTPTATITETRPPAEEAILTPTPTLTQVAGVTCLNLDDMILGATYPISQVMITSGFPIVVAPLDAGQPATTDGNYARIGMERRAGGAGYELQLHAASIRLSFDENRPIAGFSFVFAETSDILKLKVNEEELIVKDFIELNGLSIGGANAIVFDAEQDGTGSMDLNGSIRDIEIGGQELWVDHLCAREPASAYNREIPLGLGPPVDSLWTSSDRRDDLPDPGVALPASTIVGLAVELVRTSIRLLNGRL